MAVQTTEEFKNGGATSYAITIEYLKESDIKVRISGALQTYVSSNPSSGEYTVSGTTVTLGAQAASGTGNVHIYRETDVDTAAAVFAAGSSIRAADLNAIHDMARFASVEHRNQIITADIKDGQITSAKIEDGTIVNADINASAAIDNSKIADGLLKSGITVNSANIVDGSIVNDDVSNSANISGSKLADDSVTLAKLGGGTLPSDIVVTTTNIQDGTIVNADINTSADISGSKLANDSVALTKLGGGALPSDITVESANIVDGAIVNVDINANAAIAGSKVTPAFGSQNVSTSGTLSSGAHTVTGNITVSGTVDGRDIATDGTKLDTIETGATADQTNAEIKTAYEANADTNAFQDAEKTKLAGIESGATGDQTNAEIRAAVEAATDSNVFTDADHTKLNGIETGATADQTNAEIKTAYEANANTNEFSDAEQSKLAGIETAATADQTASEIKTLLQSDKLTLSEMNTTSLDTRYFTESELTGGALDGRYYTETEAEAKFLRQDSSETIASGTTWSNSDSFVATTAAINARIIDLVDEVGGFTVISNELSFPNTNPQGATGQSAILSIGALSQGYTRSGTTVTIANGTVGNSTVTITGVPMDLPSGFGLLVESTSTLNTYTFHRLVPKATEVTTVATNITNIVAAGANVSDINNFADLYQISGSAPTQRVDGNSLVSGDLWFDNSNGNLRVWNGSAWAIITPSQSVLDDVAIVSGVITYSEDLGLIGDAVTTGTSNGSLDIVADALEDERTFTVTASGGAFLIDGVSKPALTLHKGWTYTFDVSDSSNGSHPLRFYAGSSQYSTNVTVTGTQGQAGAKVSIKIPETQPSNFQYYCTNHSGMGNTITVVEDPIKAVADIASSVVTVGGIASNVTTVANNTSNINAVQANATNINAVQANASNINAAVSNASNINAVVSNATNINTVAGNNSNITAVANNSSNINSAVSNASNINAAVSNATNINTVSGSISDVNRYAQEYKISSSSPSSPSAGDLWFDTSTNTLKNYNGAAWLGITSNSGIQNVADDTSPELAAALDCNNNNLTEVGTVSGNNLQIDFGTL